MVGYLDAASASLSVLPVLFLWVGVGGTVGWLIGRDKGRGTFGFWLGAIACVVGWIVVAVMEPSEEVRAQRQAAAALRDP